MAVVPRISREEIGREVSPVSDEEFEELMEQARAEARRICFCPASCDDDAQYGFHPQHAEFGGPAH